ncbi:MAG: YHS domain-containing (seleno)protein [Cellvibrionaceae bacterium]
MKFTPIIVLLTLFINQSLSANEPVSASSYTSTAIGGHDTTAYHSLTLGDKAKKGDGEYVVEWKGVKWRFISEKDSQLFAADPEKYAPAYNGHCANALSLGEGLIKTNGKYWAIFDKQLYLFYAPRGAKRWLNGNYQDYKAEADRAWVEILSRR